MKNIIIILFFSQSLLANKDALSFIKIVQKNQIQETKKVEDFLSKLSKPTKQDFKVREVFGELIKGKTCTNCTGFIPPSFTNKVGQSQVLVFVSTSLSNTSLKKYHQELKKIGGRLIIQGLVNDSFKDTKKVIDELGISLDIDPPLFEEFNIREVPIIIHARHINGKYSQTHNDKISGQVTIKHALEIFKNNGDLEVPDNWLKEG